MGPGVGVTIVVLEAVEVVFETVELAPAVTKGVVLLEAVIEDVEFV